MVNSPSVHYVSECFIKPQLPNDESKNIYHLSPWDIIMLSAHYIQKGLLFKKPPQLQHDQQEYFVRSLLDNLKYSLSLALLHFYPLAGRLVTQRTDDPPSYNVFVDCSNSPGAKFLYATLDLTISNILSPVDVPLVVQSFFDHDRAVNHDGHTMSLLSIQVTELIDGIFVGCSMNHVLGDGTSYWNFFNTWSEIFQSQNHDFPVAQSRQQPIHNRWFPDGCGPIINLPFKHHDEFISRYEAPKLRERIFHFSAKSLAKLKIKANKESNTNKISSFQSLSALVWRSITRARGLAYDQKTSCKLATNNRTRLEPPFPKEYFGNLVQTLSVFATAGELLEHDVGWAAWKLHMAVSNHNDKVVRQLVKNWLECPMIYPIDRVFDTNCIMMGSSPRFNMYGNEFGMGKAVAIRSGYANKFDGKVTSYPGFEGGGSIDLEVCLLPDRMSALESDEEFMNAVSLFNSIY